MIDKNELLLVSKPMRYAGNEINGFHKQIADDTLRFCLAFADTYEIGMSHHGFKMLYERVNKEENVYCERFFTPWVDAIEHFGERIFCSLETKTPLKQFDIIGFSIQYELSYTTMIASMKHANIPILSKDRGEDDPIIISGGSCNVNPAPIKRFIDAIFIGEMENELPKILSEIQALKLKGVSRQQILEFLNTKPYTLVNELDPNKKVKRFINKNFSEEKAIENLLVPSMDIIQDRVSIEISRGCTRGCRFCQAGMIYRPVREKSVNSIIDEAQNQLNSSGYLDLSLLSLSASDYSLLGELLSSLNKHFNDTKISLSMPSMRADMIANQILEELKKVKKSGFTIAPEAGTQRMRNIINKDLTEEQIIQAAIKASENGWNGAKLYFMIGQPFETDEDVLGIVELAKKIHKAANQHEKGKGRRPFNVTVSVSNFVPKPFTPFQWFGQDSMEELLRKKMLVANGLKKSPINFRGHKVEQSFLEAIFSRGGDIVGDALEIAVDRGAMFEAWSEFLDVQLWKDIFSELGDLNDETAQNIASKAYDLDKALPWDNIDVGVSHKYLLKEWKKSETMAITDDCRDICNACGLCDFKEIKNIYAKPSVPKTKALPLQKTYHKYILTFERLGNASLSSALELTKTFIHALSISGVDFKFSQGFSPTPVISYLLPLPVGVAGTNEKLIIEASNLISSEALDINSINNILPKGFRVKSIEKTLVKKTANEYYLSFQIEEQLKSIISEAFNNNSLQYNKVTKKGKDKVIDANSFDFAMEDNIIKLKAGNNGTFNIITYLRSIDKLNLANQITRVDILPLP